MDVGLGLWTMRSVAAAPAPAARLYGQLREDARLAERLGYHSLWLSEHHFWYDGWCPDLFTAAATVAGATETLHVGTGVQLLPLRDPDEVAAELAGLQALSGGRVQHGVGLGYRPAEYDGFGVSLRVRGRRMDAALDRLLERGRDLLPPIWVGGIAPAAIERGRSRGLGLLLPSTVSESRLRRVAGELDGTPLGLIKYAWPTDGSAAAREAAARALDGFTREYLGSWFEHEGQPLFALPELLDGQVDRAAQTALIGTPEQIAEALAEYEALGLSLCVLHLVGDGRAQDRGEAMAAIAQAAGLDAGRAEVGA